MPKIYTVDRGRMLQAPPVPQMDAGARGFRVDLGELVAASKPTKIDPKGFIVEGIGGAQLGEGLQKGGGAIDKMAAEMARSVNNRRVMEAENRMIEGTQEIAEQVASEPDDTKWVKLASEKADAFQKQILTKDLSPDAHEEINQKWLRWKSYTVRETMQAAFARSRESEATEFDVRRQTFAEAGNPEAADAQTDEAVSKGLINKGVGAKQKAHTKEVAKLKQEKKQIEQTSIDAAAAPELWLERNASPPATDKHVDYAAWRAGQSAAREAIGVKTKDASDDVSDALTGPDAQKLTDKDIERIAGGRLSYSALAAAYADRKKIQDQEWKKKNLSEEGVARSYVDLVKEVEAFKGERGDPKADEAYARLNRWIQVLLPPGLRDEVAKPLNRQYTGEGGPKPPEPLKKFVSDRFQDWFEDERFGVTKKLVPVAPGDAGYDEFTVGTKLAKLKKVDDPPKRDAAKSRHGGALLYMHKWMEAHPAASQKEVEAEMFRAIQETSVPAEVQKLMGGLEMPVPAVKIVDWDAIKARVQPATAPAPAPAPEPAKKPNKKAEEAETEAARKARLREAAAGLPTTGAGTINPVLIPFEE
jgi:hypothetical protein